MITLVVVEVMALLLIMIMRIIEMCMLHGEIVMMMMVPLPVNMGAAGIVAISEEFLTGGGNLGVELAILQFGCCCLV